MQKKFLFGFLPFFILSTLVPCITLGGSVNGTSLCYSIIVNKELFDFKDSLKVNALTIQMDSCSPINTLTEDVDDSEGEPFVTCLGDLDESEKNVDAEKQDDGILSLVTPKLIGKSEVHKDIVVITQTPDGPTITTKLDFALPGGFKVDLKHEIRKYGYEVESVIGVHNWGTDFEFKKITVNGNLNEIVEFKVPNLTEGVHIPFTVNEKVIFSCNTTTGEIGNVGFSAKIDPEVSPSGVEQTFMFLGNPTSEVISANYKYTSDFSKLANQQGFYVKEFEGKMEYSVKTDGWKVETSTNMRYRDYSVVPVWQSACECYVPKDVNLIVIKGNFSSTEGFGFELSFDVGSIFEWLFGLL